MILTCPACATRYRVSEQELAAPAGRIVRCANCGEAWREAPPAAAGLSEDQAISSGPFPRAEPEREAASRPIAVPRLDIRLRPPMTVQPRLGRARLGPAMAAILVLVVLAGLAGVIARRHMAAIWPSVGHFFASAGLPAKPAEAGLAIEKIVPVRTAHGLTIDGEIANRGRAPEEVPRLRVALQDAGEKEVQLEIVDPPKPRLQSGEIVHFATFFAHPPGAATGVVVTFASR